jgi:hypothetical protein
MDITTTLENLIKDGLTEEELSKAFSAATTKVAEEKKQSQKLDDARTAMIESFINYCLALGILKPAEIEDETVQIIDKLLRKEEKSIVKNSSLWLNFFDL